MKVKKDITLKCIARHGLVKIGSLHPATIFPTTGAINIKSFRTTWTAHPVLFVRDDGTPDNSRDWANWEIVTDQGSTTQDLPSKPVARTQTIESFGLQW